MDELIRINYDSERPTVNGRDLHDALGINTKYADWFPRMCEYGFSEGQDYCSILRNRSDGLPGKGLTDHLLTIDMAKQLCMIQRTDIGRKFRQYFIQVEEAWNSPEAIMARALQFANQQLALFIAAEPGAYRNRGYSESADHRDETEGQLLRCCAELQRPYFYICYCQGLRQVCHLDEPIST